MNDHRWVQVGGLAGIVYVVANVVGNSLSGSMPDQNASVGTIVNYVTAHRHALVVSGIIEVSAFAFVLWWLGTVHHALRLRDDQSDSLASVVLASGIVAATFGALSNLPGVALAMMAGQPGGLEQTSLVRFVYDLQPMLGGASFLMLFGFVFSLGVAFVHRGIVRSWLGWFAIADAAALGVGGAATLAVGGPSAMLLVGVVGILAFMLVILATSIALLARTIEPLTTRSPLATHAA